MFCALPFPPLSVGSGATYFVLEVWPARQAKNAAAACSQSSALLNLRRGCFGGGTATDVAPLMSSTPRRRPLFYSRPICTTRHNALSRNMRVTQQSRRGKQWKSRRLCLSAPDEQRHRRGCRTGVCRRRTRPPKVSQEKGTPGPTRQLYTALRGLVQIGLMAAK